MDYKDTLNLPKTEFPMKANLSQKEPDRIDKWIANNINEKILLKRDPDHKYVLHDGPPYANGHIHIGHALNKILKDFIVKIKSMEGYYSPYVPGWDCHGLPIEHQVDKELGDKKHSASKSDIRKLCRKYAEKFIDIQREEFKRLGIIGDWDNPYITMDYDYEAITVKELYKFFHNKGIYKGSKPVYWCISCTTALAEAEVEYDNHTSNSIYVKFQFNQNTKNKFNFYESDNVSAVIWTTTPWTLPANLGVALHTDFEYSFVKVLESNNSNLKVNDILLIASELTEKLMSEFGVTEYSVLSKYKGSDFDKEECIHPFYNRVSLMVNGGHVTLEQGTGLVHTAPGHGQEDYEVGLKYGLEIYNPVDDHGNFKKSVELFAGLNVNKANKIIIEHMEENGSLIKHGKIDHSYPHCWRCKSPVIYRATPQWFISMEKNSLRNNALKAIKNVRWTPYWGENRITAMIENRPDWCISRQRSWGVPIAVFSCVDCEEIIINDEIESKVVSSFREHGADAWFDFDNSSFLGEDFKCPKCGSVHIKKETDILDVWFDSGVSHAAVCEVREELGFATMYLEGSDQHRGWFHSTLLESVGTRGKTPYTEVLTHGFVVDGKGRKMSKSVGNVVTPKEIIDKYGAEILRLWVSAEDYTEDIRISDDIIKRLVESYRKIRNTARYILGNLYDFDPDKDSVPFDSMLELDKYILIRWQEVKERIYKSYKSYQFHVFYHTFLNFCINDLSAFYLDIIKDRCYAYKGDSKFRRSAQTAMYILLKEMSIIMTPILSFSAEEIWEYLPEFKGKNESVLQEVFPEVVKYDLSSLTEKWNNLISIRKEVNKALEISRNNKIIGHSLDAKVVIGVKNNDLSLFNIDEGVERIFIVSECYINSFDSFESDYISEDGNVKVSVSASEYEKCERCWVHADSVGKISSNPTICSRCSEAL